MIPTSPLLSGAFTLYDGLTLADLWQGLHGGARAWSSVERNSHHTQNRLLIDGADVNLLQSLSACPAARWSAFCEAAGWTIYGAIALSWCADAELADVWSGWEASGFPLRPEPAHERPARLLNSALLPDTLSLRDLTEAAGNQTLPLCAMIAAKQVPLIYDLPDSMIARAGPQLAAFLKANMARMSDPTPQQRSLMEIWSQTVKDTEYDVGAQDGSGADVSPTPTASSAASPTAQDDRGQTPASGLSPAAPLTPQPS